MSQRGSCRSKSISLLMLGAVVLAVAVDGHAQDAASGRSERHDLVTFSAPDDWRKETGEAYVQFSTVDGGDWAQIGVYRSVPGTGDVRADFTREWTELVANPFGASRSPETTEPQQAEGWSVMSGAGVWQFNSAQVTTLLTVYTGFGVSVSILCNATAHAYFRDCQRLIGSASLQAPAGAGPGSSTAATDEAAHSMPSPHAADGRRLPDGRYGCALLTAGGTFNGIVQMQWITSHLPSFTLSGERYRTERGGGAVRRVGDVLAFAGGELDGYQGAVLRDTTSAEIVFRGDNLRVAQSGSARWGDIQCSHHP